MDDKDKINQAPTVTDEKGQRQNVNANQKQSDEEEIEELQKHIGEATSGDSVAEDLKSIKDTAKNLGEKLTGVVKPHHERVVATAKNVGTQMAGQVAERTSKGIPKRVLVVGVVVLVILMISIFGRRFGVSRDTSDEELAPSPTLTAEQIPSPAVEGPFIPANASVYATDSAILKIEEINNILRNEMFTTVLSEPILFPPTLDYGVSFK